MTRPVKTSRSERIVKEIDSGSFSDSQETSEVTVGGSLKGFVSCEEKDPNLI